MTAFRFNPAESIVVFQELFHEKFPFLRIQIVKDTGLKNHFQHENRPESEIQSEMTVRQVQDLVMAFFGTEVRVMRGAGKTWVSCSRTQHWTLAVQNDAGHDMFVLLSNTDH
ncbi:MAG: hypothetical protein JNL57_02945 [Bacteroidetes bacterium]|nr:hypothetical protein [Bacteroidota bacterium]